MAGIPMMAGGKGLGIQVENPFNKAAAMMQQSADTYKGLSKEESQRTETRRHTSTMEDVAGWVGIFSMLGGG